MHIMLTRPIEDSKELIFRFKSLGHNVSHLPVINIKKIDIKKISYTDYTGIIFTSSNAVRFLETKNIDKTIYCFCVGSATESYALKKGFQNVYAAEGNVENLKEIISQYFNKNSGKLLYVSGEVVSSNIHEKLIDLDYQVDRIINYSAQHIKAVSYTHLRAHETQ